MSGGMSKMTMRRGVCASSALTKSAILAERKSSEEVSIGTAFGTTARRFTPTS
jgi:hypothetical protein